MNCMKSSSKLETVVNRRRSNSVVNDLQMKRTFIIEESLMLFSICSTKRVKRSSPIALMQIQRKISGWAISQYFDETMVNVRIVGLSKYPTTSCISSVGSFSIVSVIVASKFEFGATERAHAANEATNMHVIIYRMRKG